MWESIVGYVVIGPHIRIVGYYCQCVQGSTFKNRNFCVSTMAVVQKKRRKTQRYQRSYNHWHSYVNAKMFVQNARSRPTSRSQYHKWHDNNLPIGIPKYPDRVYGKEWTSWNDYLGTDNAFVPFDPVHKDDFRPYYDAQRYIHSLKLSTRAEYVALVQEGKLPDDIPKQPFRMYDEWVDWPTWLGVSLRSRVESMANVKQCVALCSMADQAPNVLRVLVCQNGIEELKKKLEDSGSMKVLKMYEWKVDTAESFQRVMDAFASEQGDNEYIVSNMAALVYELDSCMLWWN